MATPPPAAEFLVAAGDSTFWVTTGAHGIRVRGAPMLLAHSGGRFYEVYVADDDRSYYRALFTGQRVYRRDLETGDSIAVFEDSAVAHAAHAYGVTHPREAPLGPDDDAGDDPSTSVTGTVEILDIHGPYVSVEYHGAREGRAAAPRRGSRSGDPSAAPSPESVRRAVLDLRSARAGGVMLRAIFGARDADSVVRLGRAAYAAAVDSVVARQGLDDERATVALQSLAAFPFDPTSFSLTDVNREPAVAFLVPGRGAQGGKSLVLPPVRAPAAPVWWEEERRLRPLNPDDSTTDEWQRAPLTITAHYDTLGSARLALRDASHREWVLAKMPAPVRRVYWLDRPTLDATTRRALVRAFDESALYADDARAARLITPRHRRPLLHLAARHVRTTHSFR